MVTYRPTLSISWPLRLTKKENAPPLGHQGQGAKLLPHAKVTQTSIDRSAPFCERHQTFPPPVGRTIE